MFWPKLKKIVKSTLKRIPYISGNGTLRLRRRLRILRNFLYFLKKNFSYIFGNVTLHFLSLGLKNRKKSPLKKVLIFSEIGTL